MKTPTYIIMTSEQAGRRQRPLPEDRTDWSGVVGHLANGEVLFVPDTEIDSDGIKYLQLAFKRRGQGENFSALRVVHHGVNGRQLSVTR